MTKKALIIFSLLLIGAYFMHLVQNLWFDKNIRVIHTYQEIAEPMKKWDKSTLIFFDIDDTLIHGPYLFPQNFFERLLFRVRLLWRYPWLAKPARWEEYYSLMWAQAKRNLIEPEIAYEIQTLQNHGCMILGLTSMETGKYGIIDNMPEWRVNMLTELGIIFSNIFEHVEFTACKAYRSHYPELYKGILCCNQQPKAKVLAAFLNYFQLNPKKIVFFDDQIDEIKEVSVFCKKQKIPFEGYQYLGAEELNNNWSMQKALSQLDMLVQYGRW